MSPSAASIRCAAIFFACTLALAYLSSTGSGRAAQTGGSVLDAVDLDSFVAGLPATLHVGRLMALMFPVVMVITNVTIVAVIVPVPAASTVSFGSTIQNGTYWP